MRVRTCRGWKPGGQKPLRRVAPTSSYVKDMGPKSRAVPGAAFVPGTARRASRGLAHVDRGPGRGHRLVLGAGGAVQGGRRGERARARRLVVGRRREVRRQRLVPDLQRLGAADAGDRGAVGRGRVVGHAVDRLRAAALGQQVEEVVRDARRVVDVQVADRGGPGVRRAAVLAGLVHVAQRGAVAVDVDLLADEVVTDVVGVGRVELHARAEDVRGGLVEAAGLAGVVQARRVRGDAVAHLVAGHVQRGQRADVALAVAVRHAEAAVVPERVHVLVAVVHAGVGTDAVVLDAAAAEGGLVEVPRLLRAVGGVHGRGLVGGGAGGRAGAPHVVGVREQGARRRAGAVGLVVRLVAAARGVREVVRRAGLRGAEADRARVQALAGAGGVLDALVLVELLAGGGVGDDVQLVRGAVVLEAADDRLVGEDGGARAGPDHLARTVRGRLVRARGLGGGQRLRLGLGDGDLRGQRGDLDGGLRRLGDTLGRTGLRLVDDQVAAEDGQTLVGALIAGVDRAVGVSHDVLDDQLLLGAEAYLLGRGSGVGLLLLDEGGARGRGQLGRGAREGGLAVAFGRGQGGGTAGGQTGAEQGPGRDGGGDGQGGALVTRVEGGHTSSFVGEPGRRGVAFRGGREVVRRL